MEVYAGLFLSDSITHGRRGLVSAIRASAKNNQDEFNNYDQSFKINARYFRFINEKYYFRTLFFVCQ